MTLPPPPTDDPQVRRLEWWRFAVAASMLGTMLVETTLAFTGAFYSLWLWLAVIAVQWYALHRMTQRVNAARARAIKDWMAALTALSTRH